MIKTETNIGRIVVVVNGSTFGNLPGTVTKVLSKPGAVQDSLFEKIGVRQPKGSKTLCGLIMCEKKSDFISDYTARYLNKPATYEHIFDLKPATEEQKKSYRRKSKTINHE